MDLLDVKLFRELAQDKESYSLQFDIRKSFGDISTKLGIDEDTVRNRIEKLRQTGFLRGWTVFVNPNLIGLYVAQIFLDISKESSKRDLIDRLKTINGVNVIINCFGGTLIVYFLYKDTDSFHSQKETIERAADSASSIVVKKPFPESKLDLTGADLLILRSIRRDPRKLYSAISKETGLSTRTVRRRLDRMVEGKALMLTPDLDLRKIEGLVSLTMLVVYNRPESKNQVESKLLPHLRDNIALAELHDPEHTFMVIIFTNISKAEETAEWVRGLSGVSTVRLDIEQDRIEIHEWIDREIDDNLKVRVPRR